MARSKVKYKTGSMKGEIIMQKITRRQFMGAASLTAAAGLLSACGASSSTSTAAPASTASSAAAGDGTVAKPDGYPKGNITWIVTSSAGGAIDLFTRALADSVDLGGNVAVENIEGGSQSIGTTEAFTRPADGLTLCSMATTGLITMPLTTEVAYSPADFRYLAKIAPDCYGVAVSKAGSELDTGDKLFDLISNKDASYKIAVSSVGGHSYVEMAQTMIQLGTFNPDRFVVYSGSNGVLQAVESGEADFGLLDDNYIVPYVKNGDINALMTCYTTRSALLQDTPCLGEHNITDLDPLVGFKILAIRKDTDDKIVQWITQQVNTAIMDQKYQDFLSTSGVGTISAISTEEELNQMIQKAAQAWDAVLTEAGLK
jgi:tripartite-type tricarboxylate transporter receptor subunit TctC